MCTVLLPPGVNPIAVKYIISYIISLKKPKGRYIDNKEMDRKCCVKGWIGSSWLKIGSIGCFLYFGYHKNAGNLFNERITRDFCRINNYPRRFTIVFFRPLYFVDGYGYFSH